MVDQARSQDFLWGGAYLKNRDQIMNVLNDMLHASSEDKLRRLSNPRAVKLNIFGTIFYDTGNFNKRLRREALGGSGGMPPPPRKVLKSEILKTQFPAL